MELITIDRQDEADAPRGDAGPGPQPEMQVVAGWRPECVYTAVLRYRVQRGDAVRVPAPPHVSTLAGRACEAYWTDWAEQVRAAVAARRDR